LPQEFAHAGQQAEFIGIAEGDLGAIAGQRDVGITGRWGFGQGVQVGVTRRWPGGLGAIEGLERLDGESLGLLVDGVGRPMLAPALEGFTEVGALTGAVGDGVDSFAVVLTGDTGFPVGQELDIALQDDLGSEGDPTVTLGEGGLARSAMAMTDSRKAFRAGLSGKVPAAKSSQDSSAILRLVPLTWVEWFGSVDVNMARLLVRCAVFRAA
jgi:hypothetical protein